MNSRNLHTQTIALKRGGDADGRVKSPNHVNRVEGDGCRRRRRVHGLQRLNARRLLIDGGQQRVEDVFDARRVKDAGQTDARLRGRGGVPRSRHGEFELLNSAARRRRRPDASDGRDAGWI